MKLLHRNDIERAKLDAIEDQIAKLAAEIVATRDAPLPFDETEARLRRAFEGIAQRQAFAFSAWNSASQYAPATLPAPSDFGIAELSFIFGEDEIIGRIMNGIRAHANGQSVGLPAAQRAKRIAELRSRMIEQMKLAEREALALEDAGCNPNRQLQGVLEDPRDYEAQAAAMLSVWSESDHGERTRAPKRARLVADNPVAALAREINAGAGDVVVDVAESAPGIDQV